MPYAMNISQTRLSCNTAPTGIIEVDVKLNGSTIYSSRPQIPTGTTTSVGGAQPGSILTSNLTDNGIVTFDIIAVGSPVAGTGLKAWLIGT